MDSLRNLFEGFFDRASGEAILWEFWFKGEPAKVAQLDENYFFYYCAKANYAIGISIFIISVVGYVFCFPVSIAAFFTPYTIVFHIGTVTLLLICFFDATSLRWEIKQLLRTPSSMPHVGAYTRLKPSPIRGVGVFAIRDIPSGKNVFEGDTGEMCEINLTLVELTKLPAELKSLYLDFCVYKDGTWKGPTSFNNLTVGWYLNHSKDSPNVRFSNYDFFALRDIKRGRRAYGRLHDLR